MLPTFSFAMNLGETAFYADLKGCYFVGMSLCRQCESSTFGMRAATLTPYVVCVCLHTYVCLPCLSSECPGCYHPDRGLNAVLVTRAYLDVDLGPAWDRCLYVRPLCISVCSRPALSCYVRQMYWSIPIK